MPYECKIIADSLAPSRCRLTTFEVTYPRIIHAEMLTHRVFSRNSASSRAIPMQRLLARVENDPFLPVYWGRNEKGMQASAELEGYERARAREIWLETMAYNVAQARKLDALGVHKQIGNRLVEPWMYITVIITATDWTNFFAQRCDAAAQPEIRKIAEWMMALYYTATPRRVEVDRWHLPYVLPEEVEILPQGVLRGVSVARCARVSYLTHDGRRDTEADLALYARLQENGHWSPFEHVAQALHYPERCGNFRGWYPHRKDHLNENRRDYTPDPHRIDAILEEMHR